jgi:hypothetical protein
LFISCGYFLGNYNDLLSLSQAFTTPAPMNAYANTMSPGGGALHSLPSMGMAAPGSSAPGMNLFGGPVAQAFPAQQQHQVPPSMTSPGHPSVSSGPLDLLSEFGSPVPSLTPSTLIFSTLNWQNVTIRFEELVEKKK